MSDEIETKIKDMAKGLGDSLIDRVKGYLKDENDTEFLKAMALELSQLHFQALTATTEQQKQIAKDDIGFIHARIDTWVAREAIKVHSESQAIFEEILGTVGDVVTVLAKAALAAIIPG